MSTLLFVLGLWAAFATLCAVVRVRHPATIGLLVMMLGWLSGELAPAYLALQVTTTAVLVALGALDDTIGWIGLAAMAASWLGLVWAHVVARRARGVFADALASAGYAEAAARVRAGEPDRARLRRPFSRDMTGIEIVRNVSYGDRRKQCLDVYRPAGTTPGDRRPVMLYIHGGAWISGTKRNQALPMLHQLARHGWVCVTINYRLAPRSRWPAMFDDVAAALRWTADHIGDHGGDAGRIVVSGGSAGGHLAALAALTPTTQGLVSACVPIYGAFDFTDSQLIRGNASLRPFLQRMVMPTKLAADRAGWDAASPIHLVSADAPPFFVIQGALDVLVYVEEARVFVDALSAVASQPVAYAEIPGAQHAFDMFASRRSLAAVDAIEAFGVAVVGAPAEAST